MAIVVKKPLPILTPIQVALLILKSPSMMVLPLHLLTKALTTPLHG